MLWFLSGNTNIKFLKDNGVRIWDEWSDTNGDLTNSYGNMWRAFPGTINCLDEKPTEGCFTDQIKNVIKQIKVNPNSRRHIVTAWHPGIIHKFALPPCHAFFQFLVRDKELNCNLYMRENLCAF
jgi:thymidylate synthase